MQPYQLEQDARSPEECASGLRTLYTCCMQTTNRDQNYMIEVKGNDGSDDGVRDG